MYNMVNKYEKPQTRSCASLKLNPLALIMLNVPNLEYSSSP